LAYKDDEKDVKKPLSENAIPLGELGLVPGVVVFADLDKFEDYVESRGLSKWRPNEVTGLMTSLGYELATKWRGVVVYGVDPSRGTEEFILEIPFASIDDVMEDLVRIKNEINKLGVGVTIAVVEGLVGFKPARDRREAYYGTPARRKARELLLKAKSRGGNAIVMGYA